MSHQEQGHEDEGDADEGETTTEYIHPLFLHFSLCTGVR